MGLTGCLTNQVAKEEKTYLPGRILPGNVEIVFLSLPYRLTR